MSDLTNTSSDLSTEGSEGSEVTTQLAAILEGVALLPEGSKLKDVIIKINELIAVVNAANTATPTKERDRGPNSTREMTEDDARRVVLGDLDALSHKDAAATLGLSYGQIYSARKGFTFKGIYKELRDLLAK